jgi:hypothetical protein
MKSATSQRRPFSGTLTVKLPFRYRPKSRTPATRPGGRKCAAASRRRRTHFGHRREWRSFRRATVSSGRALGRIGGKRPFAERISRIAAVQTGMKSFFSLAMTTRMVRDEFGFKSSGAIGEKGHGTKIYFNSRRIEVQSAKDGVLIEAVMDDPRPSLQRGTMPVVEFSSRSVDLPNGTTVTVRGYNDNAQGGFGHDALKDYILGLRSLAPASSLSNEPRSRTSRSLSPASAGRIPIPSGSPSATHYPKRTRTSRP